MNRRFRFTLMLFALGLIAGCGDSDAERRLEEEAEKRARAMEQRLNEKSQKAEDIVRGLTRAVEQLNENVETVSKDELKKMLPVEVPGMERTNYSASRRGIEGFSITHVEYEFESTGNDNGRLKLSLTDIGNISGFTALGLNVLNVDIDEENQDGFKRTGLYKGFRAFEKHETRRGRSQSEVIVFVDERFIARAEASNVEWDLVEDVFDSIPIEKLPKMID